MSDNDSKAWIGQSPSCEKYWEEKDDHEKIVKLGIAVEVICKFLLEHEDRIDLFLGGKE